MAFASASAARRCFSSAAATRRFSAAASESESESLEPLELLSLSSSDELAFDPPPAEILSPRSPACFVSLKLAVASAPRAIPGGGDAGRRGCVW